jgi:predicted adenine nucleotide alpha hydrolase (AANH) superfamily ATPase
MEHLEPLRAKLVLPKDPARVLLHCCCAPCAGDIIETMMVSSITPTLFFYNPNIDPQEEYFNRKKEVVDFATRKHIPFVDADYDREAWSLAIKGLEKEPEGGKRCAKCFELRLKKTASYCLAHGFNVFTTTLGISRYKNFDLIASLGMSIAQEYPGLTYWDYNWRKQGGSERMYKVAKQEGFYMQDYCGCQFSLNTK